ncbi:hypothetical protein ACH5RR_020843 [Cinchona calisaya]|uniref:Reverse transcriptase domain-containing protein n=1 Tax=Cinchona calisaya TaxID=153742 RepID=A0ABD2ZGM0_9GENT
MSACFLKTKNKGKTGFMALKLDMAKSYDRIEWSFLSAIINKMGFNTTWINWIMACVSSFSYSFNLNGDKVGSVKPARGIRQGDPLSPYLFILCAEGFTSLLNQACWNKQITGLKICKNGPSISHLFYADDSLIFCRASNEEANKVMEIIHYYEATSGQLVNFQKSSIFISRNTTQTMKDNICHIFGEVKCVTQGKYLGLPMVITKSKN